MAKLSTKFLEKPLAKTKREKTNERLLTRLPFGPASPMGPGKP